MRRGAFLVLGRRRIARQVPRGRLDRVYSAPGDATIERRVAIWFGALLCHWRRSGARNQLIEKRQMAGILGVFCVTVGSRGDTLGQIRARGRRRMKIQLRVECHAGYRADERPLRFELRGRLFEVTEVEDRWYSPGAIYFRVRAEDGNFYILRHDEGMDVWTLDAFRTSREYEITPQPLDVTTPPGPHGAS